MIVFCLRVLNISFVVFNLHNRGNEQVKFVAMDNIKIIITLKGPCLHMHLVLSFLLIVLISYHEICSSGFILLRSLMRLSEAVEGGLLGTTNAAGFCHITWILVAAAASPPLLGSPAPIWRASSWTPSWCRSWTTMRWETSAWSTSTARGPLTGRHRLSPLLITVISFFGDFSWDYLAYRG